MRIMGWIININDDKSVCCVISVVVNDVIGSDDWIIYYCKFCVCVIFWFN